MGLFLGCEARPYEPDYDNPDEIIVTEGSGGGNNVEADAEPALIMLRHMWQSVQELKRKQNSEDIPPAFGQGLAQQLEVLRKLNRRQALRRQIENALENGGKNDEEFNFDSTEMDTVAGSSHSKMDPHFPSETSAKKPLQFILGRTTSEPKN
uniref:Uncharacterized protein n=1 Tax=Panagrolaimus sp. ES5 TaxID=591445 RepID=A0AC34FQK6_9BILA